jgi:predicted short-subunit dehydrogenase-like oxidoreductase (DUF2520 family)
VTRVSLIYAGWLPQDGDFRIAVDRLSRIERNQLRCNMIAHRSDAGNCQTLADTNGFSSRHLWGCSVVVEHGQ